ncbi:hypothetical protein RU639_006509 [Aspergillus parasiticus]
MPDAVRPSKESFESVLHRSRHTWSSFRDAHDGRSTLPTHCIDLRNILGQTPGFLAANALPDGLLSFDCVEEGEGPGPYDISAKGKSTWKTSNGTCDTKPRTIPKQLLLATQIPPQIEFSVNAPFATWPNIEGIYHGTEDNHIAALFLAWAYILSARWAELLDRSTDHRCRIDHIYKTNHVIPESFSEYTEEAVADGFEEAQVFWWNAILAGNSGWKITADAWLNPAFAVINPILENGNLVQLATILGRRRPQLAPRWLGAIMTGIARSELRDIRDGLTAIDLHAAAWTGTKHSFISLKPGVAQEHTIRREDDCRLLSITASDGYTRVPGSVWKPFGQTSISDTDLAVPEHAHCGCHCFEYHSWYWCLTDGEIEDPGLELTPSVGGVLRIGEGLELPLNIPCDDSLSEGETRGIFQWLRISGYPASERAIYQREWMDAGSSSEEEVDDGESSPSPEFSGELVEAWMETFD